EFLAAVERFLERAAATGARLDGDAARQEVQSLLAYWANLLYRAGKESADFSLAEYNEAASALAGDQCPYLRMDEGPQNRPEFEPIWRRLTDNCLTRLDRNRLVAVVGVRGSGRSVLVRGAVLPELRGGKLLG